MPIKLKTVGGGEYCNCVCKVHGIFSSVFILFFDLMDTSEETQLNLSQTNMSGLIHSVKRQKHYCQFKHLFPLLNGMC